MSQAESREDFQCSSSGVGDGGRGSGHSEPGGVDDSLEDGQVGNVEVVLLDVGASGVQPGEGRGEGGGRGGGEGDGGDGDGAVDGASGLSGRAERRWSGLGS